MGLDFLNKRSGLLEAFIARVHRPVIPTLVDVGYPGFKEEMNGVENEGNRAIGLQASYPGGCLCWGRWRPSVSALLGRLTQTRRQPPLAILPPHQSSLHFGVGTYAEAAIRLTVIPLSMRFCCIWIEAFYHDSAGRSFIQGSLDPLIG